MPPYPVLVLQNHAPEGLGRLGEAIARNGLKARVLEMWNGDRVPSTVAGYRALVVLGGPQSAYNAEHVPYLADELRAIREARATRLPVLGICLGAQLVAHALGGRAYRGPRPEIGVHPVQLTEEARKDRVLRHLPEDAPACHWHGDTFDLPPDARRLASTPAYANQAFVVDPDVYGLQFHLEWDVAIADAVTRGSSVELAEGGMTRERFLEDLARAEARTARAAAAVFDAFLTECGCND